MLCNKKTKLNIFMLMIAVAAGLGAVVLPVQGALYSGGGTPGDPYIIDTPAKMNDIGANPGDWGSYFLLTADIDLGAYIGTSFNIIGSSGTPFTGVFDGDGHTISNFTYTSTGIDYIGLFGYVNDPNAEIKNLGLIDPYVFAGTGFEVGSLVGRLENGTITVCYSVGGSVIGNAFVGGLVGYNNSGTVSSSYATGSVSGIGDSGDYVGGLVGINNSGTVSDSYATGSVSGDERVGMLGGYNNGTVSDSYAAGSVSGAANVGGLVGWNDASGTVSNSYAAGSVSGDYRVGGLVGNNDEGLVNNSYAAGSVSATADYVGGLAGRNSGTVSNSYATGSVSGVQYLGGLVGYDPGWGNYTKSFWDTTVNPGLWGIGNPSVDPNVIGESTANMQTESTFTDAGWDFITPIWTICEELDYPRLWWEKYGGGSGTEGEPYLIFTPCQMQAIGADSNDWDKHFKLMEDIDLGAYTGTSFNIIGSSGTPFTGVFDGNGHTISNFTYSSTGTHLIGLFGYVDDPNAEIKDLGLIDPNVDAGTGDYVGSLVGRLQNGTITDCNSVGGSVSGDQEVGGLVGYNYFGTVSNSYATGSVSGTDNWVGGLVGWNNSGTVTNSYATGSVSGWSIVGGLVGWNNSGTVSNCCATVSVSGNYSVGGLVGLNYHGTVSNSYATGSVSGTGNNVGGLVGYNYSSGTVSNSYAEGSVTGTGYVGGLVGLNASGSMVTNSYSVADVNGVTDVGGLIGYDDTGSYTKSFWDNTVNPDMNGIGNTTDPNVIGESTANMQTESTFTDAGWDFATPIWTICEGLDYPRLWWEEKYGGGSGTTAEPYLIYTPCQMQAIGADSNDWDKHFKLMADIDLGGYTGTSFNIIGSSGTPFTGVFDGDGHTISNFTYSSTGTDDIGLFGYIDDPNAEIKDLGLIDPNVDAGTGDYVGSLVGWLTDGTVNGCYAEGGSVSGGRYVGGLVGFNRGGTVSNSYATGSVSGTSYIIGGLVGENHDGGTVSNSYATGSVSGTDDYVGGLVGYNKGSVSNSYATGSVSGIDRVGGLVGYNPAGSTVSNSYATGSVSGGGNVGGLVGYNYQGTVSNSYSVGEVNGVTYVGGLVGYDYLGNYTKSFWDSTVNPSLNGIGNGSDPDVIGESTANMQTESTFTDAGWDFATPIWTICEGWDYPRLWWDGGSGTEGDPYLIYTPCQMQAIGADSNDWDKHFKLMEDIDLGAYTGTSFNIIGNFTTRFTGVFDGDGHTISNFTYSSTGTDRIGLFGYVDDPNAEIKDLGLIDPNVDAGTGSYVGSLVGNLEDGTITGCSAEGDSISGDWFVGGLVGRIDYSGTVSNSYATGSVSGDDYVGGLVGTNTSSGTVTNGYATGSVSGNDTVGGLVGYNGGTVSNSYATASVSGSYYVGGLVGDNDNGTVSNSYATGSVTGTNDKVGGLVGANSFGTVSNSYATGSVSGDQYVGGLVGSDNTGSYTKSFWDSDVNPDVNGIGNTTDANVIGESTANMQTESTFTDAGWDFVCETANGTTDIWTIPIWDGLLDYPRFTWQDMPTVDFACPHGIDFGDFAILGLAWGSEQGDGNWNPDCDISEPNDNVIDEGDLGVFVDNWLAGVE